MGSACQRSHSLPPAHRRHLEPVGSPRQMMQEASCRLLISAAAEKT